MNETLKKLEQEIQFFSEFMRLRRTVRDIVNLVDESGDYVETEALRDILEETK